jgi:hypothetical protein
MRKDVPLDVGRDLGEVLATAVVHPSQATLDLIGKNGVAKHRIIRVTLETALGAEDTEATVLLAGVGLDEKLVLPLSVLARTESSQPDTTLLLRQSNLPESDSPTKNIGDTKTNHTTS